MKKIDIITKRKDIFKQRLKLERDEKKLNWKERKLKKQCSHELVFKWNDNESHKVGSIYKCFCPVCTEAIDVVPNFDTYSIEKSPFKRSSVIEINSNKSESEFNYYRFVEDEVLSNMEYYYNSDATLEEMSKNISDKINKKSNSRYKIKRKTNIC